MTTRRHEPLSEEQRAKLRHMPGVIYRRRAEATPIPFVSEIHVTGYINTLELLGRSNDEDEPPRSADSARGGQDD